MVIELSCQNLSLIINEDHLLLHEIDSLTAERVCIRFYSVFGLEDEREIFN